MPIDIQCQDCRKRFRVPDKFEGRRVKCPNCEEAILVRAAKPAAEDGAKGRPEEKPTTDSGVGAASAEQLQFRPAAVRKPDQPGSAVRRTAGEPPEAETPALDEHGQWYLKTDDGEQYGPVDREELDEWVAEERIDGTCQLLCDGWDQWKWADEVFPHLAEEASTEDSPLTVASDSTKALAPVSSKRADKNKKEAAREEATAGGVEQTLAETQPWVLLTAILALGTSAVGVIGSLVILVLSIIGVEVYGIVVATALLASYGLGAWPSLLLLVYAQRMRAYVASSGTGELEQALIAQRAFWRLAGILGLVAVGFWFVTGLLLLILVLAGVG